MRSDDAPPAQARKRVGSDDAPPASTRIWVLGALFLAVSAAASIALSMSHLGGIGIPGCGEGSPCGELSASRWGALRIGGFAWSTAYFGMAYFLSLLIVWIARRGRIQGSLKNLVRLGALGSLGFVALMIAKRSVCGYCVAAHAGNFAFLVLSEIRPAGPGPSWRDLRTTAYGFLAVTVLLLGAEQVLHVRAGQKAERELAASTQELIDRSRQAPSEEAEGSPAGTGAGETSTGAGSQSTSPSGVVPSGSESGGKPASPGASPGSEKGPGVPSGEAAPPAKAEASRTAAPASDTAPPPRPTLSTTFTGRYRIGPENAAIRIVIFTDYQCQDCYNLEQQLVRIRESRDDVSISIKQFPFDSSCNPFISKTMHPNACAAAYAAEAAGRLWGPEAFWKMHKWLFSQRGVFRTSQEIEAAVRTLGYDASGFTQVMVSPEVREAIRSDAEEAKKLGLFFTPMVFINGVELRGWSAPNALIRAVEGLAAAHPPAASPAQDHPPLALEKYIEDWREGPRIALPPDPIARVSGPPSPRIDVVIWGDYQEDGTAWADSIVRVFAKGRQDVRYSFRHFPVNSDCNPKSPDKRHPDACRQSLAAEAAGRLGGSEGFWRMHAWLMAHRNEFSEQALREAFRSIGLDETAALAAMDQPEGKANISEDVDASTRLPVLRYGMPPGLFAIPTIIVDQRYVPRWDLDDHAVLMDILQEAARE